MSGDALACRRRRDRQLTGTETGAVIQTVAELIVEYLRLGVSAKSGPRITESSKRAKRTPGAAKAMR